MEKLIKKLTITQKRKKPYLEVKWKQTEVSKDRQTFDANYTKDSDQPMSSKLSHAVDNFIVHLLHASEMIDGKLDLKDVDFDKYVNGHYFKDDDRYKHIYITSLEFSGKQDCDGLVIKGYRETQLTRKAKKVKFETGVIDLNRELENPYALSGNLCDCVDDLVDLIMAWKDEMETTPNPQLSIAV